VRQDALHLVPLGGTGEIGMNLNAYHTGGRWLIVDCGVMFERFGVKGQRALFPDVRFLDDKRDRIEGVVLTHAHQDHLGAVRDLWPRLNAPVWATRFAAEMLRDPLREVGLHGRVSLRIVEEDAAFDIGPFRLERIPLTHSTVEMGAFVLRTAAGTVLHTGDWKLDPDPRVGRLTDEDRLRALATEPVAACVSDSTNALVEGWTPSEGSLLEPLARTIGDRDQRVAVALFSSNVARIDTLVRVARRVGRHVVLLGRSLRRTVEAARAAGYLEDLDDVLVDDRDFGFLPRGRVMLLCTGSQGEPRAALSRLAEDSFRDLYLEPGDTVVYSAKRIPGCETWIDRVQRLLREKGVEVVDERDAQVHVSGHPRREELRTLYRWVQPRSVVPVHGTPAHLDAHAALAEALGLPAWRIRNGHILRLAPEAGVVGSVPTGRILREEPDRRRARSGRHGGPRRDRRGRGRW